MSIKSILQGNWLGHPLHPALVHVPAGVWPAALLFDALACAGVGGVGVGRAVIIRCAFWCVVVGLLAAVLAVPTGLADFTGIKREKPAWKLAVVHLTLNVLVFALFVANLILRIDPLYHLKPISKLNLALSAVAVGALAVSGYIGGRMVFEHGVSVARLSKNKWRALAAAGHANLPPEQPKTEGGEA